MMYPMFTKGKEIVVPARQIPCQNYKLVTFNLSNISSRIRLGITELRKSYWAPMGKHWVYLDLYADSKVKTPLKHQSLI